MARQRDDREVQIDNSTNGRFCNAFQWLVVITALNVGTLLILPDISCRVADVNQVYQLSGTNANATTVAIGHVYCKVAGKPEKEVPRYGTRETSGNASVIT